MRKDINIDGGFSFMKKLLFVVLILFFATTVSNTQAQTAPSPQWFAIAEDEDQIIYVDLKPLQELYTKKDSFDPSSPISLLIKTENKTPTGTIAYYTNQIECKIDSQEYRLLNYSNYRSDGTLLDTNTMKNTQIFPIIEGTAFDGISSFILYYMKNGPSALK